MSKLSVYFLLFSICSSNCMDEESLQLLMNQWFSEKAPSQENKSAHQKNEFQIKKNSSIDRSPNITTVESGHTNLIYECKACFFSCQSYDGFKAHTLDHIWQQLESKIDQIDDKVCSYCKKVSVNNVKHYAIEHLEKSSQFFYCKICQFPLLDEPMLREHLIFHLINDFIQIIPETRCSQCNILCNIERHIQTAHMTTKKNYVTCNYGNCSSTGTLIPPGEYHKHLKYHLTTIKPEESTIKDKIVENNFFIKWQINNAYYNDKTFWNEHNTNLIAQLPAQSSLKKRKLHEQP